MIHSFNTELASLVGIEGAILYNHLCFWVEKNEANNKNFIEGYYWTYNSYEAWEELFPYMSSYTIKTALKRLKELDLIDYKRGLNQDNKWDKTNFYRIVNKAFIDGSKNEPSKESKSTHHNSTDNNTDNNNSDSRKKSGVKSKYDIFIEDLKSKASRPSKVTKTEKGKKLFKEIKDLDNFSESYLKYQLEKGEFAVRVTAFMEDYIASEKNAERSNPSDLIELRQKFRDYWDDRYFVSDDGVFTNDRNKVKLSETEERRFFDELLRRS